MILVVIFILGVSEGLTKSYELKVPGSRPIQIVEKEPEWYQNNDKLQQFLNKYGGDFKRNDQMESVSSSNQEPPNKLGELFLTRNQEDKSKSWDLMHYEKHHHPYDDHKGWVTMEPIPWSISKISKWESNVQKKPNYDRYDDFPEHIPEDRPAAVYGQNVKIDYNKPNYYHKHDENCNHPQYHNEPVRDIITDGLPSNFPQATQHFPIKRRISDTHPESHPFAGNGEWVLLSTTKGYKYPQNRQRSLKINRDRDAMKTHRSVRLTVLPPLKNSKINMTTSHGGLLQVESTFETVDQARNKLLKKQRLKKKIQKQTNNKAKPLPITTMRTSSAPDSSAVLAAVGAGMIPATMAMLVPMAMGGKRKRRRRDVVTHSSLELTIPRNL